MAIYKAYIKTASAIKISGANKYIDMKISPSAHM